MLQMLLSGATRGMDGAEESPCRSAITDRIMPLLAARDLETQGAATCLRIPHLLVLAFHEPKLRQPTELLVLGKDRPARPATGTRAKDTTIIEFNLAVTVRTDKLSNSFAFVPLVRNSEFVKHQMALKIDFPRLSSTNHRPIAHTISRKEGRT